MKEITIRDILILIILFAIITFLLMCYVIENEPSKVNKRTFGEKHRAFDYPYEIRIIANEPMKYKLWGKGESCACGLNDEDFEAYVAWKTKGLDVHHIKWELRDTLHGERCIGWAWVFIRKGAKDEKG